MSKTIVCPSCGQIQSATVDQSQILDSYGHTCEACWYMIMESEWEEVDDVL